ncbi:MULTISPECIES: GyrI-like domain-containing protein [unclassified Ruegeria]|uniref:AraC family transcriptional regulator n=1 Tax=unclassified Ruegeria TaxID=2625375 RepID=UPI0014895C5C|nr:MULTISPECIES: AraC family transcriptional regulator [unclassified Ruegeria]NOD75674.1 helix-turn-helix domain-containing protein [Ruegeria sp. HKCCD4332]NOD89015.1 helix-turn-helix domain-containing protein [Ruegeria sp. HKCCD4318]NOE14399.1 helix-turn-helix domain-containing protein [Ruegeria sp. HKCCD4318-2]NOG10080.1 AraC family transcriptional regulator [Ruegeria sp. HKCCD4315]
MPTSYEDRVLRVLAYIHDNPAGDLSLDALADVAAMSRFHWHRVFRALTGETCAQAVRRVRLHRAATWLVQSDKAISDIALSVGYPNPSSFARAFSEAYGSSPAAFRKAGQFLPAHPDFKTGGYPMHPVTTRTEPARRVVALPHKGAYSEIGKSFEAFGAMCESRQLWPQIGPVLALYFDSPDDVPEDQLRSYAGAEFRGENTPEGLDELSIPGGKTAVLTYKGPYSGIAAAYHSLFGNWLPESGEEPADQPCYEIYLNDPRDTAPEDLLTEICLPLK